MTKFGKQGQFIFISFLLFLLVQLPAAHADFYLSAIMSQSQTEYYKGVEKFSGIGYGTAIGYKFSFLGVEAFYKANSYDDVKYPSPTTGEQVTTSLSSTVMGLGGRLYFLFFNIKGGVSSYNFDHKATASGTALAVKGNGSDTGLYAGLGARIPLAGFFDVFADYTYYYAQDFDKDIFDLEGGIRFYF